MSKNKERIKEALKKLIAICDAGKHVECGAGGMTIDAQIARTIINGIPASAIEEAREALEENS